MEFSSSIDLSTGFNKVIKDMTEVKSEWCAINRNLNSISSSASRMEPEIACLRSTFGRMETSLAVLKSEGLNDIVSNAMKALISRVPNLFSRGKGEGLFYLREYSIPEHLSKSVQGYGTANELGSFTPAVVSRFCIPEYSREQELVINFYLRPSTVAEGNGGTVTGIQKCQRRWDCKERKGRDFFH